MKDIVNHHDGHGLNESISIIPDPKSVEFGAPHLYRFTVSKALNPQDPMHDLVLVDAGYIQFQRGPRHEADSTPGVTSAAVIAMLIHHLKGFQAGLFPSRQSALAVTKLEEALFWIRDRADERSQRGVLGKAAS
jgi:hypothetical protein